MTDQPTVLLCAPDHGAPRSSTDSQSLIDALSNELDGAVVEFCVVSGNDTGFSDRLSDIKARSAGDVVCVPTTPFAGDMQKRLLPDAISGLSDEKGRVLLAGDAGVDPAMLRAARSRVEQVLGAAEKSSPREESLLMIVGHGSIDMDANGNLMKMARMIWEGLGFGWAEVAYVNGAFPSIEQSLAQVSQLGFKSIVVLPYVIVGDEQITMLPSRIAEALGADDAIQVLHADILGAEGNVVRTLAARLREAVAGNAMSVMNCQLCTYREQVLALEAHDHHHDHSHEHDHRHDD